MGMFDKVKNNSVVSKAKELDEKSKTRKQERAEMYRIKREMDEKIKVGDEIIKRIMGTKMVRNAQFNMKISRQGVSALKISSVWGKINKQVKSELREGNLELDEIPGRIDQLLVENSNPKKIQENAKKAEKAQKILGVEGYDFACTLHEKRMSAFGNQKEDVINGFCFVNEDRLIIKKISVFTKADMGDKIIPYEKINAIDYDKAGKFHVTSSIVISISGFDTIILKNINDENFKLLQNAWLNFNDKSNESNNTIIESNRSTNADELLKYAELYKQGLLTEEEFEAKKKELL